LLNGVDENAKGDVALLLQAAQCREVDVHVPPPPRRTRSVAVVPWG
jgi:hypothetical protein